MSNYVLVRKDLLTKQQLQVALLQDEIESGTSALSLTQLLAKYKVPKSTYYYYKGGIKSARFDQQTSKRGGQKS